MKTKDLEIGEVYFAEIGYSTAQVIPMELALWTAKERTRMETVTQFVEPATPFDPNTGEKNDLIERTREVKREFIEFVPGNSPSKHYKYGQDYSEKVGVPCFVRDAFAANQDRPDWKPALVRPADIKMTWNEKIESQQAQVRREDEQRKAAIARTERVARLAARLETYGLPQNGLEYRTDGYGRADKVVVPVAALEKLLDAIGSRSAQDAVGRFTPEAIADAYYLDGEDREAFLRLVGVGAEDETEV